MSTVPTPSGIGCPLVIGGLVLAANAVFWTVYLVVWVVTSWV